MSSSGLCCFLLLLTFCSADGFLNYRVDRCDFNSSRLEDIQFIRSFYFNKRELVRFDSRVGKFVGYTEFGVKQAEYFNQDPGTLAPMRAERERYCLNHVGIYYQLVLTKSVKPTVRLFSTQPSSGHHDSMLVCRVFSFYPKNIKVSWLKDGHVDTSDVTTTEEMPDGDWYYQVLSHLEYTPRSGEKISCMVEHASLKEPLITDWELSMPESERNQIAIGASGLILGLILSLAGFIYYKRKSRGRVLVPSN
ncbi:H-2 class II histocompatibility antigen, E-S beta chain [Nothobranchius furzeri]|uniref:Ig-like domain-containing protein n=1 Tax=Nothobranchius furzeri TaxID=105023 RepID=A0A1A7ZRC3_NOTFU